MLVPLIRVGIDCTPELLGMQLVATRPDERGSRAGGGEGSVAGGGGIVGCDRRGGAVTIGTGRMALGVGMFWGTFGGGGMRGATMD